MIEDVNTELLASEVENYVRILQVFQDGKKFLSELNAAKNNIKGLDDRILKLKDRAEKLKQETDVADENLKFAESEYASIVAEAKAKALEIIRLAESTAHEKAKEVLSKTNADAKALLDDIERKESALKKNVSDLELKRTTLEGTIQEKRYEIDALDSKHKNLISQIEGLLKK